VVAAQDPLDAARQVFLIMKERWHDGSRAHQKKTWEQKGPPRKFNVWRFMTPAEFKENIGSGTLDDEYDEDTRNSYDTVSDMLLMEKVEVSL